MPTIPPPPVTVPELPGNESKSPRKALYGKGYNPDTHDKSKDSTTRHLFGARAGLMPAEVQRLEQYVGSVWDQRQTSSCVGHAFARAVSLRCAVQNVPISDPSRTAIYTFGREIDRTDPSVPLVDDGCKPNQAVRGMQEYGVPSEAVWPFDPTTIDAEVNLDELEKSSEFTVQGFNRIDTDGVERVLDICQALAADYPVCVGTIVGTAFENYTGGILSASLDAAGGHMLCFIGYKTDPVTNTKIFRGVNSWSSEWGDRGFFWADETFVKDLAMTDIYVVRVSKS